MVSMGCISKRISNNQAKSHSRSPCLILASLKTNRNKTPQDSAEGFKKSMSSTNLKDNYNKRFLKLQISKIIKSQKELKA